ncbi:6-bladed beta-propeller [Gracilimonas tropica]|uniref:6-bladed beta-propeller n=1 Tax=Gracilimonas tropica TaxID=454600 RepID=UPI00039A5D39|nr:6-bladed beta-propeller [Gracilimonas tropica]
MNFNYLLLIICIICSCDKEVLEKTNNKNIEHRDIENLTTIKLNRNHVDSVYLFRERTFESNDEVFIKGYINTFIVDDEERIFISASIPGTVGVYVFDSEGKFITRIANEGRGPGEYEGISSMDIWGNNLILFDPRLQKIGVFSLDDFSHVKDISIDHSLLQESNQIPVNSKANRVLAKRNGDLLIGYRSLPGEGLKHEPKETYFRLSNDGVIQPDPVLQLKSFSYYYPDGPLNLPFTMPFTRSSLLALCTDGRYFTTWTGKPEIKILNRDSDYESTIHFELKDVPVDMDDFELYPNEERTLSKYELPETWQKFHTIEFDDKGQLWVSMITNNDSTFKWAVLNKDNELIAEFKEKGSQKSYSVISKPNRIIRGGYFYSHEFNMDKGIDRIVKYKIEFVKR